jgi:arabinofuranosyltransferase
MASDSATAGRSAGTSRWTLLAIAPALLLLWAQVAVVWPFCSDDAFISLRYSERLLAGHGLSWTDGERVEGYSNLLWVLLCAGLAGLGLDLVTAARLLGVLATALGFVALARALWPRDLPSAALAATAPLLAAATQPLLGWTCGGLEGPLSFALLAWGFGGLVRHLANERSDDAAAPWSMRRGLRLGVPFALACWTRPDGPLWVASAGAALLLVLRGTLAGRVRAAFWLGLLPMLAVLAQLAFRLAYHGDVVPNTAHVKTDVATGAWTKGLEYVGAALQLHTPLLLAVATACLALARPRTKILPIVLVLLLPTAAWLCYLIAVGGDHFPGRRLLHGAIAPLALLATVPLRTRPTTRAAMLVAAFATALLAGWQAFAVRGDAQTHELRAEVWESRGQRLGEALRRAFADQQPLLAVDAAGAVPFYSQLPSLDLLGLCDRTIALSPTPAWQATMRPEIPRPPGHLKGNGRYVMDRTPDLLLLANPPCLPLPVFASACEFEDDPRFLRGYHCVMLELADVVLPHQPNEATQHTPLWVRTDGRVGVQRAATGDTVTIPAWLFGALQLSGPIVRKHQPATNDAAVEAEVMARLGAVTAWYTATPAMAVPGTDGALLLEVRSDAAVAFSLPLAAGRWRAEIEPRDAAVRVLGPDGTALADAATFVVDAGGTRTLRLQRTQPTPVRVQCVRLVRLR